MTRWLWTAPTGLVTDLSDWGGGAYVRDDGTDGTLAPRYDFATQQLAGIDGATVQQISAQPGTPQLAVDLVATDGVALSGRLRALAHALRPRAGIGTLSAVADDGSVRSLPCYYRSGLEKGTYRATRYRTVLEFFAPSPWWRGEPIVHPWSLAAPGTFFPILPMRLSPSTIAGQVTLDLSDCDTETYPTWTVTGPGSQLTLSNTYDAAQPDGSVAAVTRTLVLNAPIGDGQTVTIDTRPGYQAVTRGDGVSLFGSLGTDPALFPLVDGVNTVAAVLGSAGAASRIELTADRLYSGAL